MPKKPVKKSFKNKSTIKKPTKKRKSNGGGYSSNAPAKVNS